MIGDLRDLPRLRSDGTLKYDMSERICSQPARSVGELSRIYREADGRCDGCGLCLGYIIRYLGTPPPHPPNYQIRNQNPNDMVAISMDAGVPTHPARS